MSKSNKRKRDVSFIKPNEPAFIARMKAQIGYKEGPTVDTKRETLPVDFEEDAEDKGDEQPQVVVVDDGDLTAEEADKIQRLREEGPADLNKRVVFRKPSKGSDTLGDSTDSIEESRDTRKCSKSEEKEGVSSASKKKNKDTNKKSSLLSFNEEDENQE